MKNVFITGLIIGVLSGVSLLILYIIGYLTFVNDVLTIFISRKPFNDISILVSTVTLILIIGLYFGLTHYKHHVKGGDITFLEALFTSLKILITGLILIISIAVIYIHSVKKESISDFAGLAFGTVLVVVASALTISFIVKTKSK